MLVFHGGIREDVFEGAIMRLRRAIKAAANPRSNGGGSLTTDAHPKEMTPHG